MLVFFAIEFVNTMYPKRAGRIHAWAIASRSAETAACAVSRADPSTWIHWSDLVRFFVALRRRPNMAGLLRSDGLLLPKSLGRTNQLGRLARVIAHPHESSGCDRTDSL